MKNNSNKELIALLVRVYNHSIQFYDHFPDVIIYGNHRLEQDAFDLLLQHEFIIAYHTDSFGKLYRLSKKGEDFLYRYKYKRRPRHVSSSYYSAGQASFQFV